MWDQRPTVLVTCSGFTHNMNTDYYVVYIEDPPHISRPYCPSFTSIQDAYSYITLMYMALVCIFANLLEFQIKSKTAMM